MSMKSSHDESWFLNEGRTVQSWSPNDIFPSLTSENITSTIQEIMGLFTPETTPENQAEAAEDNSVVINHVDNHSTVRKWNLEALQAISADDTEVVEQIAGMEGTRVNIAQDDKQHMIELAKKRADEIIHNANSKAKEIITQAQQQVEQIHKDAYDQGKKEAVAEMHQALENAQLIVNKMETWRKETVKDNQELLVEMTQKIARLIFGKGFSVDNETMQSNLNRVIKMADSLGEIRIYMNHEDSHILDPEWRSFQEALSGKKIQIIPSESILPGGCFVQGEMGVVDARIETQLNAIADAMNQGHDNSKDGSS